MFETAAPALTFDRLLLEEVMRHGYNTLCRRDILDHLCEVLQNNCAVDSLGSRIESVRKLTFKEPS